MTLLRGGFKPRKMQQKAANQLRKITVQTESPANRDASRINSVRLRKPKLRGYGLSLANAGSKPVKSPLMFREET